MAESIKKLNEQIATLEADLKTAWVEWREEFDKRKAVEKELNGLGEGTDFMAVEKLRKDINTLELEIFNTRETIREKTESMQEAKGIDNSELGEKRDGLRTLKQQCEQEYKNRKKELDNELKQEQHRLSIDETAREKADMNKGDWKEHVKKVLTKQLQDAIPLKLEALHEKQQRNIEKMELQIQEKEEAILLKYGACEEEIRKQKTNVDKMKITLHDLEMARENRIEFADINYEESLSCDCDTVEAEKVKEITAK
jgi:hypothetical protein